MSTGAPSSVLLALDCSFAGLTLALETPQGLFTYLNPTPRASDGLHSALQSLCDQAGIGLGDVATIAVTTGPGSFTGIRLGLAVAQALRLVTPGLAITGLPTLHVLAHQYQMLHGAAAPFAVVLDAAGGQAYRQRFAPAPDGFPRPLAEPEVIWLKDLPPTEAVYAPAALHLPQSAQVFDVIAPSTLHRSATEAPFAHHSASPLQPLYLKPLTYRPSAG